MLAGYRSFYLYSALSVALVALAVAGAVLLSVGLRAVGVGPTPTSADVSRALSLAVAIVAIALPVGGAHLVLILRGLRDPQDAASDVRHGYLTVWTTGAILVDLGAGMVVVSMLSQASNADPSTPVAIIVITSLLGIGAHLWARATPPRTYRRRVAGARVAMAVTLLVAAGTAAAAASAAGQLFDQTPQPSGGPYGYDPRTFAEQGLRSGGWTAAFALALWAVSCAWQWRWRAERQALQLGAIFTGAGAAFALPTLAVEASGLIQRASGYRTSGLVTGPWPFLMAGLVMLGAGVFVLLVARGAMGAQARAVDRLVAAIFGTVGLGSWVGGLAVGWGELNDHVLFHDTPGVLGDLSTPLSLVALGLAVYVPAWWRFRGLTREQPADATRRFTLFSIVCLALVALVVAGVTAVYNLINGLVGVGGGSSWARLATTAAGVAALAAAVFTSHLLLLLRDQRAARSVEPRTEAPPIDPLVEILEEVRAGRVSVADAAARVRSAR